MSKDKPKGVVLVDQNGDEHVATTPSEVNSLVFGFGYRPKDTKKSVDQAIAELIASDVEVPVLSAAPIEPTA